MALILGTNCGFVTEAPTGDPEGSNATADVRINVLQDTSPAGSVKVTEIGWYSDRITEETNFEVGIYTDNSNGGDPVPDELLAGESRTNAKGTTAGWKRVTGLNITISANTLYWIAVQIDDTDTSTYVNYATGGEGYRTNTVETTLISPWVDEGSTAGQYGIYAIVETAVGTNTQIQIGGAWKAIEAMQIQIGGAWHAVEGAQMVIDDGGKTWKTVF